MQLTPHIILVLFLSATHSTLFDYFKGSENYDKLVPQRRRNLHKKARFQVESNHGQDDRLSKDLLEKAMMLKKKTKEEYDQANEQAREVSLDMIRPKKKANGILPYKRKKKNTAYKESYAKKKKYEIKNYKTLASKQPILQSDYNGKYDIRMRETKKMDGHIGYALDPVLNFMDGKDFRRKNSDSMSASSSIEMQDWKDTWKEHWLQKKVEVAKAPDVQADDINMVAARPWGVPCGDPNQHDMPWGSCLLPMECEAEYRIYRGDFGCGRTQYVCCALQLTNYDLYQGFDLSFENSGPSADSEEKKAKEKNKGKNKRDRDKQRRKKERDRRKEKIKKKIKQIVKEIRKILNRAYKNGTQARKKKTKQLKKFIKDLKKKFKKNRISIKQIHELEMIKIDDELQRKLDKIRSVNQAFMNNATFREIVLKGVMDKAGARMLMEAYPDLATRLGDGTRKAGVDIDHPDYDVEYGMVYY